MRWLDRTLMSICRRSVALATPKGIDKTNRDIGFERNAPVSASHNPAILKQYADR
jgi:hypothetical protein